ncbi:MAG: transporter substrate-binding domain-containing protein [[Eubacterium] siraeum]
MKIKRIIAGILVAATCGLAMAGCQSNTTGGKLIMATEPGFAPYEYMSGNNVVGIDVDIANEVAKELGMELEIQSMDFDGALLAVQQGKVDFAAAGISLPLSVRRLWTSQSNTLSQSRLSLYQGSKQSKERR